MKKIDKKLLSAVLVAGLFCLPFNLYAGETQSCPGINAKALKQYAEPYQDAIQTAAKRYTVKPSLIKAVIAVESCFDHTLVSPEGRVGLMQLMPDTAKRFGALDVYNPEANIDAGTRYLSYLLKRYQGSLAEVFAAYASDSGRVAQDAAPKAPFRDIREPVSQLLGTLLKLENNKKANRQAQALLKKWDKSEQAFQAALLALPKPNGKAAESWFQSRLARVHYQRTPELRSCGGLSTKTLNSKAAPYEDIIQKAAKRYTVNPALIKSVIAAESCYREMVVSYKGASGLMQLMPETAEELGVVDIFDPQENIHAGTRYLGWLLRQYNGSITHVIAAYNAGAGRIGQDEPVTIAFTETRGYIRNVLTNLTKLEKGKQPIQNAQLLLADWEQAELEYQAALRGETLASIQPEAEPVEDGQPQPEGLQPELAASVQPQAVGQQVELAPAFMRAEKVSLASAQSDMQPSVQLISALDQGIVRVKRISVSTLTPAEPTPVMQAQQPTTNEQLQSCEGLPLSLLSQTQQKGNGRYGAFFYAAQQDETLDLIAAKLGVSTQDVIYLNNISPDDILPPGSLLKVAECARTL